MLQHLLDTLSIYLLVFNVTRYQRHKEARLGHFNSIEHISNALVVK